MNAIVLDTHAIIWYFLQSKKLSPFALATIYLNLPLVTCDSKINSLNIPIIW